MYSRTARKKVLIDHGFRLPSAAANRPLKGEERTKARRAVFVSATPETGSSRATRWLSR